MDDPRAKNLLNWSIQNSNATRSDPNAPQNASVKFDPQALQELMGMGAAMSESDMMKQDMQVILDPDSDSSLRENAWQDFHELIEGIDNANNLEGLGLWVPLVQQLKHDESTSRLHAASCVGTVVQNNPRGQERLLVLDAIPTLVRLATEDADAGVRLKAIRALSSASRNFQPALDVVLNHVPSQFRPADKIDAGDMAAVDALMDQLRASSKPAH